MNAALERSNLNVLLIEDNANDAEFFEHHLLKLRDRKAHLETCKSLAEGLQRLAQGGTDIVFLDLTLPDSSGLHTLVSTHSKAPAIPIIVLTGRDDDDLASHALSIGAQDYLVKGHIDPGALGRAINYAIERQRSAQMSEWIASVVESSNDAIYAETMDGIIRSWNHGAELVYGYNASEVIGRTIALILPPGCQDSAVIRERVTAGERVENYETIRLKKDGGAVVVSVSAAAIKNSDGETTGISFTARDMTRQRLSDEALKESNQRLNLAVQVAKIGIWQWDTGTGRATCDDRSLEQFGITENKTAGSEQPRSDLTIEQVIASVHPDDRARLENHIARIKRDQSKYDCEYRVIWPDDSVHDIEARGELSFDTAGNSAQMTGVSLDVTERKRAARALEESEHRLRQVLESAQIGIWDMDLVSGAVWHSFMHDKLFGYDQLQPDWTFEQFLAHVVPEDREQLRIRNSETNSGDSFYSEFRIVNVRDNAIHWLSTQGEAHKDVDGKATRMLGVIADITERKKEEQQKLEAAKHSEQVAHSIVQHAPVGIVTLNADLRVTDSNIAFAQMVHSDSKRLLDAALADILPLETFHIASVALKKAEPLQLFRQHVLIGQNGSELVKYWDMSFWPIAAADGMLEGAVLQITDCTATVNLEQQREDFVAAVAHDIKNPLIGAERVLDILSLQPCTVPPESQAKMLAVLKDSNRSLLNLVQNLVDVYRFETMTYPVNYEAVDLKLLLSSCLEQVASFADSREVTTALNVPDSLPPVQADEVGIRRVFMNLLHNAIKFNRQGGKVTVNIKQQDRAIQIDVVDNGDGMDETDQKKLFQRFSQGKAGSSFSSGTGLGLYLSKQIMLAHRGNVSCKTSAGTGSIFSVSLPLTTAPIACVHDA